MIRKIVIRSKTFVLSQIPRDDVPLRESASNFRTRRTNRLRTSGRGGRLPLSHRPCVRPRAPGCVRSVSRANVSVGIARETVRFALRNSSGRATFERLDLSCGFLARETARGNKLQKKRRRSRDFCTTYVHYDRGSPAARRNGAHARARALETQKSGRFSTGFITNLRFC